MKNKQNGKQTIIFPSKPCIMSSACVVGPKEGRGPLKDQFDRILEDPLYGQDSYEAAEYKMLLDACEICVDKCGLNKKIINIDSID